MTAYKSRLTSHALARALLEMPDLPVITHAVTHLADERTPVRVGLLRHYTGDYVCIGDFSKRNLGAPNWHIEDVYIGGPLVWE
jgi:hypothetical protein